MNVETILSIGVVIVLVALAIAIIYVVTSKVCPQQADSEDIYISEFEAEVKGPGVYAGIKVKTKEKSVQPIQSEHSSSSN